MSTENAPSSTLDLDSFTSIIATFRFDYEYEIKYEYYFGISTQLLGVYPPNYNFSLLLTNT